MINIFAHSNQLQKKLELYIWTVALTLLFFMDINDTSPGLCLFKWLNIPYCPGCGLGHSMHAALQLQFAVSLKLHPMGIAAVFILLNRIKQLLKKPKTAIL